MKQLKNIYFQFILSLILVITLVTGCVAPAPGTGKDTPIQEGTAAKSMRRPRWKPRNILTR